MSAVARMTAGEEAKDRDSDWRNKMEEILKLMKERDKKGRRSGPIKAIEKRQDDE